MAFSHDQTDEVIAKKVQDGQIQAFGELVERYESKMSRYANRFLFGNADSEDVVQEVFLKAFQNIQSFDVERKFSPWLYRIAHNEFINAIKRKGREPLPFFDTDTIFPHPVFEDQIGEAIDKQKFKGNLANSLNQLSAKYREPLVLYYFEEMDYATIAEIMRVPISTVGVRIKRGKEKLQKIYAGLASRKS